MNAIHLVPLKDAAVQLDVSERTVRRLIETKNLKAYRVGGLIKVDSGSINDYLLGHAV